MAKKAGQKKGKPYRHPIPSRSDLLRFLEQAGRPCDLQSISKAFNVRGARDSRKLVDQLARMVRGGQVILNRNAEYCLTQRVELATGTVIGHRDGFGFVSRDEGGDDVYLSAREMREVIHGDRIAYRVVGKDRRGRPEGKVVEVLQRGVSEIAGQFIRERGIGVVIPDNPRISHRILVARGESGDARPGQMVVVEVLDYPTQLEQMTGRILRVIGDPGQKGIATDLAIHAHAIPTNWPRAVTESVSKTGRTVPPRAKQGRVDLRSLPLVTIDGADARDFDDAVWCEATGSGWRLLVAIADVAHYVAAEGALDREAVRRGTSVYFPDRVVPMLPEALSNGLCSLNPKVDRLCVVCDMRVSSTGKVTGSKFYEAVIRSHERLTYGRVHEFLTRRTAGPKSEAVRKNLLDLHALYKMFARVRARRGAIELDLPQTRIEVGEDGAVSKIAAVERNDAHRLIEECMIAANVQAARFLRRHRIAGLYRVHARPDPERFDELRQYLLSLGIKVPHPEHVEPRQYNEMLLQARERADEQAIALTMLRSLMHAEYTPENIGHFGLALEAYAHFTSPIRRYPDLLVHRAIKHIVNGGKAGAYRYDRKSMERFGKLTSACEKRAEDATREVEATLKCQYLSTRLGEQYTGTVTGVTGFGLFIMLDGMQIDGLVHVSSLGSDYYHFDAATQSLQGERSGNRYSLGDSLEVVVAAVDLESRKIDFRPVHNDGRSASGSRRRRRR